jgi:hypothetical protein
VHRGEALPGQAVRQAGHVLQRREAVRHEDLRQEGEKVPRTHQSSVSKEGSNQSSKESSEYISEQITNQNSDEKSKHRPNEGSNEGPNQGPGRPNQGSNEGSNQSSRDRVALCALGASR